MMDLELVAVQNCHAPGSSHDGNPDPPKELES